MNGMKVKDIACGLRHTILLTGKSTTHFNDARAWILVRSVFTVILFRCLTFFALL